eukprot:TRINITY_DN107194_c0_g1_i1.p1 TRINITY_DN107194_c0_g1~~TRINITY_DN107194_c0_g1_i1.p1  ORF type:complete len:1503 (-),score=410.13 TRINITY_DN107194_c0_g1_i1:97-4557(-)
MGCGASSDPPYVPHEDKPDPVAPPAQQQQEVKVSGGGAVFTVAEQKFDTREGDHVRPKDKGFLPFVRYDTTAVPPQIKGGDHVYLIFTYSEAALEGDGDAVKAEGTELKGTCVFRAWRKDGTNSVFNDGEDVFFEHVETGKYLEGATDSTPLCLSDKDENKPGQCFGFFKQGRPLELKHRDTVYLQTWLHNYVEYRYFEDSNLYAKRWQRREPQTMTVLKKAVLDTSTTEIARRFQFQAFDLDGNGTVSKNELDMMTCLIRGEEVPKEEIDEIFATADPAHTGSIPYQTFAAWADGGGMQEEQLNHIEVLGNIAQRCNDCLHEEKCLIEVLGTIDSRTVQGMVKKYTSNLKGGDLTEKLVSKASAESDGWFFSGNWKNCFKALLEPEVDLWVRCLNDAMRGFGTDENTLTALVCTIPERLRVPIFKTYIEKCGKGLLEHISSETSFSYKKVLMWQAMAPEDCRAKILNKAMVGLGTAEDQLIRVICQLNFGERREVKEAYQRMFNRDLIEHIKSETSGNFQKSLLCMLQAEEAEFDLEADCQAMKDAMEGWGTDEATLIQMVCNKTSKQMEDINIKFKEMFDRDLLEWVRSETSGHFKDTLLGCIRHPMKQLAHSVRDCMKGWGTDDEGLITCLVHLEDFKKAALIREYGIEFNGRDLIADIKADTSGDYKRALCALVKPAPVVWAESLTGAMKGLGTADELLINFMVLAKEDMFEVRKAFFELNGKMLEDWIEGDTSGDYKNTLLMLAGRNSEETISIQPVYWAQRCRDALFNVDTLKEVLVTMPATAIKRHTELYQAVYGVSLKEEVEKKLNSKGSFFQWTNWWKESMLRLLEMPVELYVKGLWDAMHGWGTDEYTLTGLVCTLPENMYEEIHGLYLKLHNKKLVDHIVSETSFSYKKVLRYQAMPKAESRATALYEAMACWGTVEDQLTRIVICATFKERALIQEAYKRLFKRDLIQHIESETSGNFKNILVAVLKATHPRATCDYDADCDALKAAMDGMGTNEKAIIGIIAGKTPEQIETLKAKFQEKFDQDLYARIDSETWDYGMGMFLSKNFRATLLGLLREPTERLAYAVRDCIVGWGTNDTGLITLLVHLSERQRRDLVDKYMSIPKGGDLYKHISGDTSGNYKKALLALVKPPPQVWAEALHGAMAGLGTSDNLLINWMCISKERMDEVREHFSALYDGQSLAKWIDGDCGNADYKDTLIRLANRRCDRFSGQEVFLSISPPSTKEDAVLKFNKRFNKLCRLRREKGEEIVPTEEDQQEMGNAFLYYGALSSCAPNLDIPGMWDLTNACGFPPADDGPDLVATFHEWDVSGTGEITWNDFVREMATRVNDPGHFEADPLAETIDMIGEIPSQPLSDGYKSIVHGASDDGYEEWGDGGGGGEGAPEPRRSRGPGKSMWDAFHDGDWKDMLRDVEPEESDGLLAGPWGECMQVACEIEKTEDWGEKFPDGPAGMVIGFLEECGHGGFVEAADRKEQACK